MEQAGQWHRYPQAAFDTAAIRVPSVVAVEVDTAVRDIPEVNIGRFNRCALENTEQKIDE